MAKYKHNGEIVNAEQWFPGKYVEGVSEMVFDPGDGSTVSTQSGYLNIAKVDEEWNVTPGDWIVTYDNGTQTIVREAIFFEEFSLVTPWEPVS